MIRKDAKSGSLSTAVSDEKIKEFGVQIVDALRRHFVDDEKAYNKVFRRLPLSYV